jgi:hypothetical protein
MRSPGGFRPARQTRQERHTARSLGCRKFVNFSNFEAYHGVQRARVGGICWAAAASAHGPVEFDVSHQLALGTIRANQGGVLPEHVMVDI